MTNQKRNRQDVYSHITGKIIADMEHGVRPWMKPWNAEHAAGRITRPLRHNGQPYNGINIQMLWSACVAEGHNAPFWMNFRQAKELGGHVRKREKGKLVVYAYTITQSETSVAVATRKRSFPQTRHSYPGYRGNCARIGYQTSFLAIPGGRGFPRARFLRIPGGSGPRPT